MNDKPIYPGRDKRSLSDVKGASAPINGSIIVDETPRCSLACYGMPRAH